MGEIAAPTSRQVALAATGRAHRNADAVTAEVFHGGNGFFLVADKVQVKYEMLRAHAVDGISVSEAARRHGYSRAGFYVAAAAFSRGGMAALEGGRPGRCGPLKLNGDIVAYVRQAPDSASGAVVAREIEARFGVSLHRRTVERARRR